MLFRHNYHVIRVHLTSQSAPDKNNKMPTHLCAPREFLKPMCQPCFIIIKSLFWLQNKQTFYMYIYICSYRQTDMYIHIHIHILYSYIHTYVCMYVRTYVRTYMHAYMYICFYLFIHSFIHSFYTYYILSYCFSSFAHL